MPVPAAPKIYHIAHVDRLNSISSAGRIWCDAESKRRAAPGTAIGMNRIKQRRSNKRLNSHPDLYVGNCLPFYFCPRSVMLYRIYMANYLGLTYYGGQEPIVHLEADLRKVVAWADRNGRRWAFTLSNGTYILSTTKKQRRTCFSDGGRHATHLFTTRASREERLKSLL